MHHLKTSHWRTAAAFTLVELLVVIVIIITLAALSLAGFRRARSAADSVVAARNLSQYQLANSCYAIDHNGSYMPVYSFDQNNVVTGWSWSATFLSYLKGESAVYRPNGQVDTTVPLGLLDPTTVRAKKGSYDNVAASFGYNHEGVSGNNWGQAGTVRGFRVTQVNAPARTAAFLTSTDWIAKYSGRFLWQGAAAVDGKTGDGKIAFRHNGKALVIYYDGHMGEITRQDLERIDGLGGIKHPFWDADAE